LSETPAKIEASKVAMRFAGWGILLVLLSLFFFAPGNLAFGIASTHPISQITEFYRNDEPHPNPSLRREGTVDDETGTRWVPSPTLVLEGWGRLRGGSLEVMLYLPGVQSRSPFDSDGLPTWGAPIALSLDGKQLWVVNPDANSVTMVDPMTLHKVSEIAVGREPWSLALSPDGAWLYVADRADGMLTVLDVARQQVRATISVGPEPGMVALSPSGRRAYVTITTANRIAVVDTQALTVSAQIAVDPLPYALAVTDNGNPSDVDESLYITHLLALPRPGGSEATDDGRAAQVTILAAEPLSVTHKVMLAADEHGFPNLLLGLALQGATAWVPQERSAPALPNGLTTTVFAAVSRLDLTSQAEDRTAFLALNDQERFGSPVNNPVALAPSPDGKILYIVLAGSNLLEIVNVSDPTQPQLVKFLPVGQNPRGLVLSADGQRAYVMNYLGRSITALDLAQQAVLGEVAVTEEMLTPAVLRGKQLFNSAVDPRLARGSWISCASCHPDGASDGVTWRFPDGPRQTPALWNAGQTLPWHWSAALDEAQDVEGTIQAIQLGVGLAPGTDPPQLGAPNAGRSPDLDDLAAYVTHGIRSPALLTPTLTSEAGRALFISAGCVVCHAGPAWTISALPGIPGTLDVDGNGMVDEALHDVGTLNPLDIRGQTGFDVPSLLNIGQTAPYLHDGSMPTLDALLNSGHPDPTGSGNHLTSVEVTELANFLRTIGPQTTPFAR
jgi:YVTN family beta-propeller protein